MTKMIVVYDANVLAYSYQYNRVGKLPTGLANTDRIKEFTECVLENSVVVVNDFIRTELDRLLSSEIVKQWLQHRAKRDLTIQVEPICLPEKVCAYLRSEYSFERHGRDRRYLETAYATHHRRLVSHDAGFRGRGKKRGAKSVDVYLARVCEIEILHIDECADLAQSEGWW